ncbi:MAG: SprT-like domain-containing protein [Rhodoluna sp.]
MITSDPTKSPKDHFGYLEFLPKGENSWVVLKAAEGSAIGSLSFENFSSRGPSAFLQIKQESLGSISWLAEAIQRILEFGFDEIKLGKVSVRLGDHQLSLIAALEDLGFIEKSKSEGGKKIRFQVDRYAFIQAIAESMMLEHLEDREWTFDFDNGRRRAGLCSYTDKKITVSRYLSLVHSVDDVRQTILHEIAHALTGPKEGHGKRWLATAKKIGYRNETYTGEEIAKEFAPYRGICPNGHEHYRYQKPKRLYSCHICARGFNKAFMIDWFARS